MFVYRSFLTQEKLESAQTHCKLNNRVVVKGFSTNLEFAQPTAELDPTICEV